MSSSQQAYQIIPIALTHLEAFNAAVASVAREKKFLSFLEGPSLEMSKTFIEENLSGNWPHVIAINQKDNKVVGWCDISSLNRPIFEHVGVLGIGIIAEHRGKGIGERLMRAAIEKAQLKGLTRIELSVRENNLAAISLYKKIGFKVEGLHINAVRIDNQYENHLSMALLF